jgi:hypothetical protein
MHGLPRTMNSEVLKRQNPMSNQKSIEVNVSDPGGKIIGKISTTGMTQLPPSAGVTLSVSKTAGGQVTAVNGTISGVLVDLPNGGK